MKGESDSSYTPCVGLICSPFYEYNDGLSATFQVYWVMPPPEYQPHEYGKPMQMTYTVSRDSFLTQDLLLEMVLHLFCRFFIKTILYLSNIFC